MPQNRDDVKICIIYFKHFSCCIIVTKCSAVFLISFINNRLLCFSTLHMLSPPEFGARYSIEVQEVLGGICPLPQYFHLTAGSFNYR